MTETTWTFDADRSTLEIDATSSVHPIHTAAAVSGSFSATVGGDGRLDLAKPATARVELDLAGLESGNPLIDREAARRLDVRKYPKVVGELHTIERLDRPGHFAVSGELTFHGVTRELTGEVDIGFDDDGAITIEGESDIDVTDFEVQPPSLLVVKVHKDIRVTLRAVGERSTE